MSIPEDNNLAKFIKIMYNNKVNKSLTAAREFEDSMTQRGYSMFDKRPLSPLELINSQEPELPPCGSSMNAVEEAAAHVHRIAEQNTLLQEHARRHSSSS